MIRRRSTTSEYFPRDARTRCTVSRPTAWRRSSPTGWPAGSTGFVRRGGRLAKWRFRSRHPGWCPTEPAFVWATASHSHQRNSNSSRSAGPFRLRRSASTSQITGCSRRHRTPVGFGKPGQWVQEEPNKSILTDPLCFCSADPVCRSPIGGSELTVDRTECRLQPFVPYMTIARPYERVYDYGVVGRIRFRPETGFPNFTGDKTNKTPMSVYIVLITFSIF